jgi:hypothetical protein
MFKSPKEAMQFLDGLNPYLKSRIIGQDHVRRVGRPILVGARPMHNSTLPGYAILQKIRCTVF